MFPLSSGTDGALPVAVTLAFIYLGDAALVLPGGRGGEGRGTAGSGRAERTPSLWPPSTTLTLPSRCCQTRNVDVQAEGRARPGATVRARIPSVARSALSGITGKIAASFQLWSTEDQS